MGVDRRAVFIIVIILTGCRLVQTQQHLETRQNELENAKQAADQAKSQATEFAKRAASLNSQLEKANAQRNELQTKFDQATSETKNAKRNMFDPGNAGREGDLAASYVKVGDPNGARQSHRDAEMAPGRSGVADRLAKVDPENAGRQRDLAMSQGRVANVLAKQGDVLRALDEMAGARYQHAAR